MSVAVDASFLLYLFSPPGQVGVPTDSNGKPIELARERVSGLVSELEKTGGRIIVPTPALSEVLVKTGVAAGQSYISIMRKSKVFRIAPFDEKAAVELAIIAGHAINGEGGKSSTTGTYAKLKYDRMIVAIAYSEGARTLYSDDENQRKIAAGLGMTTKGLADCIPLASASQRPLDLKPHGNDTEA